MLSYTIEYCLISAVSFPMPGHYRDYRRESVDVITLPSIPSPIQVEYRRLCSCLQLPYPYIQDSSLFSCPRPKPSLALLKSCEIIETVIRLKPANPRTAIYSRSFHFFSIPHLNTHIYFPIFIYLFIYFICINQLVNFKKIK